MSTAACLAPPRPSFAYPKARQLGRVQDLADRRRDEENVVLALVLRAREQQVPRERVWDPVARPGSPVPSRPIIKRSPSRLMPIQLADLAPHPPPPSYHRT